MAEETQRNNRKPLPYWLKIIVKNQKMYVQFLKSNPYTKERDLLQARKFLKWLQRQGQ